MLPKSIVLAAAWAVLSGSIAQATPLAKRTLNVDENVPWYCKPSFQDVFSYQYLDISEDCSRNANCDHACLTFHTDSNNNKLSTSDMDDLRNVIGQHSLKEGLFKSTRVGMWVADYDVPLANDLPDSDMLQFWFHQVAVLQSNLEVASQISDFTLYWYRGSQSNVMFIDRYGFS